MRVRQKDYPPAAGGDVVAGDAAGGGGGTVAGGGGRTGQQAYTAPQAVPWPHGAAAVIVSIASRPIQGRLGTGRSAAPSVPTAL